MSHKTATTTYNQGNRHLIGAKYMYITPWVEDSSDNELKPGSSIYEVTEIVGDTVSVVPDDPETNSIESEFSDSPIVENTQLGSIKFAATCADLQSGILNNIAGWNAGTAGSYAPQSYSERYCTIEVFFDNCTVVLPKVQMNSKVTLESLKTGSGQVNIAGTCLDGYVLFNSDSTGYTTPMAIGPKASEITALNIGPDSGHTTSFVTSE